MVIALKVFWPDDEELSPPKKVSKRKLPTFLRKQEIEQLLGAADAQIERATIPDGSKQ